jgi:HEAT repeat protein
MSVNPQPGAQDPTAVYISSLAASHWKTRWQAAQALGELGDVRAVEPLLKALDDSNQWVRIVAAEALGQVRDRGATETLIYALSDNSIWVRRASVVALGQIGDPRATSPLMERLLRPPDSEWPEELHDVIARALGTIGEPAIKVLIDALDDPDVWVSSAAARALGQIGDSKAIVPLTELMKQENRWVHTAATQALAQIADARAVRAALTADEAPRAFWRLMALKEIDQSTINQLTALLEDPDEQIRARAAEVLGQLGDKRGDTGPLAAALRVESPAEALSEPLLGQMQDTAQRPTTSQGEPASEIPDSMKPLVAALQDPVTVVRLAAAEALGKIGDASVIPALNQAILDSDSRVRAAAAWSLGEIGRSVARPGSSR